MRSSPTLYLLFQQLSEGDILSVNHNMDELEEYSIMEENDVDEENM